MLLLPLEVLHTEVLGEKAKFRSSWKWLLHVGNDQQLMFLQLIKVCHVEEALTGKCSILFTHKKILFPDCISYSQLTRIKYKFTIFPLCYQQV